MVKQRIDSLIIGQRVDLQNDQIADPDNYQALADGFSHGETDHPEWESEYETVADITVETPDCICVTFESGFTCGFPPDHEVDIDAEQDLIALAKENESNDEPDVNDDPSACEPWDENGPVYL